MKKKPIHLSRKSFLCLLLCLIMFLTSTGAFAASSPSTNPITESLNVKLSEMGALDTIDVIVWIESPNLEEIEKQAKNNVGISSEVITDDLGIELIQKFILEKRLLAREAYRTQNSLIEAKALSSRNNQIIFTSEFSPMIIMRLDKASVSLLSKSSSVQKMTIFENEEIIAFSDKANINTGVQNIRDTTSIDATGKNVNIGQIEPAILTPNLMVYSNNYFNQQRLHLITTSNSTPSTAVGDIRHANLVAAIMVGQPLMYGIPYEGVAPDAELYYGGATTTLAIYEVVEEMIAQGVNVINMSMGSIKAQSYNNDIVSQWIDHLAFVHDVHFVAAAGNINSTYNSDYIYSPALAYNAITVGSLGDNNAELSSFAPATLYEQKLNSNFNISDFTSYKTIDGIYKPDLLAYGEYIAYGNIYMNGTSLDYNNGTSFAAPQVAGVIAQLCEKYPSLLTQQVGMKALLSTTAVFRPYDTLTKDTNSQLYSKMGAGILGARTAYVTRSAGKFWEGWISSSTKSINISVPSSYSYLRVGLSWIKKNSITGSHTSSPSINNIPLADLKLEVFYNGSLVATSDTLYTNTELIQIPVTQYGTYTIKVTNKDYSKGGNYTNQYIAVVWY